MDLKNYDWKKDKDSFLTYLESLSEPQFRDFSSKITPGVKMLGIRFPILKKLAKDISKGDYENFIRLDDQDIFEIKILKGYVVGNIKDLDTYKRYFPIIASSIDNWASCDTFLASSKVIKKDLPYFFNEAKKFLKTDDEFRNRIAFVMLLDHFVTEEWLDKIFELIRGYHGDHYYANMALAWLISELFIKFPERTKTFLIKSTFDKNVLKPAYQKIRDSYRVSESDKLWTKNIALK